MSNIPQDVLSKWEAEARTSRPDEFKNYINGYAIFAERILTLISLVRKKDEMVLSVAKNFIGTPDSKTPKHFRDAYHFLYECLALTGELK